MLFVGSLDILSDYLCTRKGGLGEMSLIALLPRVLLTTSLLLVSPLARSEEPIKAYLDLSAFSFTTDHTPVTKDEIVSSKWEVWTIASEADKERLRKILKNGVKHEFYKDYLRIIIIDDKDEYQVTYGGVVSKNKGTGLQIDRDELIRFQQSLDKSQREVRPLEFQ